MATSKETQLQDLESEIKKLKEQLAQEKKLRKEKVQEAREVIQKLVNSISETDINKLNIEQAKAILEQTKTTLAELGDKTSDFMKEELKKLQEFSDQLSAVIAKDLEDKSMKALQNFWSKYGVKFVSVVKFVLIALIALKLFF